MELMGVVNCYFQVMTCGRNFAFGKGLQVVKAVITFYTFKGGYDCLRLFFQKEYRLIPH